MAFMQFRLYYKIDFHEQVNDEMDFDTEQTIELHRAILPDFMDWYNDTFLERHFSIYREGEVPHRVKVVKHYPSFDKELGIVFVLEYSAEAGKDIKAKDYKALEKLIKKIAQDSDEGIGVYSDCVCHNPIVSNGKRYFPTIDTMHSRIVLDTGEDHTHIKYSDAEEVERLKALHFNDSAKFRTDDFMKALNHKKEILRIVGKIDDKVREAGQEPDSESDDCIKRIKEDISDMEYALENKDMYYLK